jgi:hypothetical protein
VTKHKKVPVLDPRSGKKISENVVTSHSVLPPCVRGFSEDGLSVLKPIDYNVAGFIDQSLKHFITKSEVTTFDSPDLATEPGLKAKKSIAFVSALEALAQPVNRLIKSRLMDLKSRCMEHVRTLIDTKAAKDNKSAFTPALWNQISESNKPSLADDQLLPHIRALLGSDELTLVTVRAYLQRQVDGVIYSVRSIEAPNRVSKSYAEASSSLIPSTDELNA